MRYYSLVHDMDSVEVEMFSNGSPPTWATVLIVVVYNYWRHAASVGVGLGLKFANLKHWIMIDDRWNQLRH